MIESIFGILTAAFMLGTPFFAFIGLKHHGTKDKVKIERKSEQFMQDAVADFQKFEEKESGMDKAEGKERHDIVEAESFVEKLKFFIDSEKRYSESQKKLLENEKPDDTYTFPHKDQFIATLNEENNFVDIILKELEDVFAIERRLNNATGKERKTLKKDLHKALVTEKQARFEHALSKPEIEQLKGEAKYLSQEEHSLVGKMGTLKSERRLIKQMRSLLQKLKRENIVGISVLRSNTQDISQQQQINKKELGFAKEKEGLIESIIIHMHTLAHIIGTKKEHVQNVGGIINKFRAK